MAKCIELKYNLINEKGGASDSTSLVIKVPEALLSNDSITSTDLLDEMISALGETDHPWHDIAKILIDGNRLSSKLLDVASFSTFDAKLNNTDLTPEEAFINAFPDGSLKVYSPTLVSSNFDGKSAENVLIRELLKSTNVNLAISEVPFDMTGSPVVQENRATPKGLYKDDIKMVVLYAPELKTKQFLNSLFAGVKGKALAETLTHELIHANFYSAIKESQSEALKGGLKRTLDTLPLVNKTVTNVIKNINGSNDPLQEFAAYYLSNIDFRGAINESNPDFKNSFFEGVFKNVSIKSYPLIANLISTTSIVPNVDRTIQPKADDTLTEEELNNQDDEITATEDSPQEGLAMEEVAGDPYLRPDIIRVKDKKHREVVAKEVASVFKEATEVNSKFLKYKKNYTEEIKVSNRNKALLHDLKQHDLIRVPLRKEVNGQWVDTEKSTYRPIVDSFLADGDLIFATASTKGNVVYYKEDKVQSIKRNKGVLTDSDLKTKDTAFLKELAESYKAKLFDPEYTTVKNGYKFWNGNAAVYVAFGEDAKSNARLNKNTRELIEDESNELTDENTSFKNERRKDDVYDENNFNSLRPGDIIKSSFTNKEGKEITYTAPIVSIQGDLIEVLKNPESGKLDTYFVNSYAINGVYMLNDNHEDDWVALDKIMQSEIKDGFSKTLGLNKVNFKNVDKNGLPFTTKNYNDFNNFNLTSEFYKGYSAWRNKLTDVEYDEMTLASLLQENRNKEAEYYKYSLAVERRRNVTDNIGPGAYIQLEQLKMEQVGEKDDKKWVVDANAKETSNFKTIPARVISKNGDWLKVRIMEPVWTDGKITDYKFTNKSVNVLQNNPGEKPTEKYSIRAVYYNNIEQLKLVDYLKQIKTLFKTNFADSRAYFDYYKDNNKNFPSESTYQRFNFLNRINQHKKFVEDNSANLSDGYYNKDVVTALSDLYELRFLEEGTTYDQKLKALARTKKGSVVLMAIKEKFDKDGNLVPNKTSAEYVSAIVTGKDKTTGRPIITYTYKGDGLPKTISRPVRLSEIVGVGYANFSDPTMGIQVDDYIKNTRDAQIKNYLDNKKIKTYGSKKEAQASEAYNNLKGYDLVILPMYVDKVTGAKSTNKNKFKDTTTEYYLAYENKKTNATTGEESGFFVKPAESDYKEMYGENLAKADTQVILSNLRPGDVVTERFEKDGKKQYKETVVSRVENGIIYGFSMYIKKGTTRSAGQYVPYGSAILAKTTGKKTGLNNVIKLELGYYGNGISSAERYANIKEGVKLDTKAKTIIKKPTNAKPVEKVIAKRRPVKAKTQAVAEKVEKSYVSSALSTNALFADDVDDAPFSKSIADVKSKEKVSRKELSNLSDNLSNMYGLPVLLRSGEDIKQEFPELEGNYRASRQRAFIKDGAIYINTDYATMAEPIHELGHLVVEGLRITNPTIYEDIMQKMITHPHYQKIAEYYPELDEDKLNQEVFVTLLGERFNYNFKVGGIDSKSEKWQKENTSLFKSIVNRIKRFFAQMFGIDSNRLFNSDDTDFMNSSINDILDKFNNNIKYGNYKKEVDIALQKYSFIQTNSLLKNIDGNISSTYKNLMDNGFTDNLATNSWVYTKSSNFVEWHNGQVLVETDGEPKIFYRTSENTFAEDDVNELGDAVFAKGYESYNEDGSLNIDENDVKSIYSGTIDYSPNMYLPDSIEDFSSNTGLPMIGDINTVKKSIEKLKSRFGKQEFEIRSLNDEGLYYAKYYDKPSDAVIKLKELLIRKNLINAIC